MKIGLKVCLGFVLLTLLILVSTFSGYSGISSLSQRLEFITGPAWDVADGAKEGTIEIEAEILALYRMLARRLPAGQVEAEMLKARASAEKALQRMVSSGLIATKNRHTLEVRLDSYSRARDALLTTYKGGGDVSANMIALEQAIAQLLDFIAEQEETGDSIIEGEAANIADEIRGSYQVLLLSLLLGLIVSAAGYVVSQRVLTNPIRQIVKVLKELSEGSGDLTVQLSVHSQDELGELAQAVNRFISKLLALITNVTHVKEQLVGETASLERAISNTSNNTKKQFDEVQQVSAAINQMTTTASEVARNAESAAQASQEANTKSNEGQTIVGNTVSSMKELEATINTSTGVVELLHEDSKNIGSVLDVIKSIAEQTNLLALNAAIEAARAGEQGRGFAVVADEVRTLAQRTQDSTSEIEEMISKLQGQAQTTLDEMTNSQYKAKQVMDNANSAGEALQVINQSVDDINSMNLQIASAAEEQTAVSEEINRNAINIQTLADNTNQQAVESQQISQNLLQLIEKLGESTGQFKV
ncbi:MAG: methyl-accepting chemotaxis protein [Pseudomonadales bacterium]